MLLPPASLCISQDSMGLRGRAHTKWLCQVVSYEDMSTGYSLAPSNFLIFSYFLFSSFLFYSCLLYVSSTLFSLFPNSVVLLFVSCLPMIHWHRPGTFLHCSTGLCQAAGSLIFAFSFSRARLHFTQTQQHFTQLTFT